MAIGLALGVGLVITVTAAAAGVKAAQGQVLHSLYGVGTDITVTETATPGSGGAFHFGGLPVKGSAGTAINEDHLSSLPGQTTIKDSVVSSISKQKGVAGATGTLNLNSVHITGTAGGSSSSAGPTPFNISTFTVAGINADDPGLGPLSASNITSGTKVVGDWFKRVQQPAASDRLYALVSTSYAKQESLKAGSTVAISGTKFTVLGLVGVSSTASTDDVYIPLSEAQSLSGDTGKVNTIYVTADNSSDISAVQKEIEHLAPKATVTTAADLASEVTGSLGTAATLADSLGFWLAVLVLLAAFVLAALLTTSSVTRRVREFGTLKAMGWRSRRIVGQVLGESVVQGLVGGAAGIGLGVLGAFMVTRFFPTLSAKVPTPGTATGASPFTSHGGFGGGFGGRGASGTTPHKSFTHTFAPASHSIPVHMTAPLSWEIFGLAVLLAVAGGLIAGLLGGWRAARLQPAEALRRVE
ncbi:MAG: FtsX-like permease family protein [Candidatus Dormiibacterota bacterium]